MSAHACVCACACVSVYVRSDMRAISTALLPIGYGKSTFSKLGQMENIYYHIGNIYLVSFNSRYSSFRKKIRVCKRVIKVSRNTR